MERMGRLKPRLEQADVAAEAHDRDRARNARRAICARAIVELGTP